MSWLSSLFTSCWLISTFFNWYLQVVHFVSCSFQMIPVFMCWSVVVAVCHLHSSNISCTQNFWIEGLNQTQQSQHLESKTMVTVQKTTKVTCLSKCPILLSKCPPPSLKVPLPPLVPHPFTKCAPITPIQLWMCHSQSAKLSKSLKVSYFPPTIDAQGIWNFQSVGRMLTQHVTLKMELSKFDTHILLPKQQLC